MIAKTVGSPAGSIFSILLPLEGIYRPPPRRRAGTLSVTEREEISRSLPAGDSYRAIARRLGVDDEDFVYWTAGKREAGGWSFRAL